MPANRWGGMGFDRKLHRFVRIGPFPHCSVPGPTRRIAAPREYEFPVPHADYHRQLRLPARLSVNPVPQPTNVALGRLVEKLARSSDRVSCQKPSQSRCTRNQAHHDDLQLLNFITARPQFPPTMLARSAVRPAGPAKAKEKEAGGAATEGVVGNKIGTAAEEEDAKPPSSAQQELQYGDLFNPAVQVTSPGLTSSRRMSHFVASSDEVDRVL